MTPSSVQPKSSTWTPPTTQAGISAPAASVAGSSSLDESAAVNFNGKRRTLLTSEVNHYFFFSSLVCTGHFLFFGLTVQTRPEFALNELLDLEVHVF
jgi:hypothetical protein